MLSRQQAAFAIRKKPVRGLENVTATTSAQTAHCAYSGSLVTTAREAICVQLIDRVLPRTSAVCVTTARYWDLARRADLARWPRARLAHHDAAAAMRIVRKAFSAVFRPLLLVRFAS